MQKRIDFVCNDMQVNWEINHSHSHSPFYLFNQRLEVFKQIRLYPPKDVIYHYHSFRTDRAIFAMTTTFIHIADSPTSFPVKYKHKLDWT